MKKSVFFGSLVLAAGLVLAGCTSEDNPSANNFETPAEPGEEILYAVGVGQGASRGDADSEEVLFTEDDILWFDVNTRELRFRDMDKPLYERLEPFHEIRINLGERELFTISSFVTLWDSRVFYDLVLCYGRIGDEVADNGCYYLYDCYPLQFEDSEEVTANREKHEAQWEVFLRHLEEKGKLRAEDPDPNPNPNPDPDPNPNPDSLFHARDISPYLTSSPVGYERVR